MCYDIFIHRISALQLVRSFMVCCSWKFAWVCCFCVWFRLGNEAFSFWAHELHMIMHRTKYDDYFCSQLRKFPFDTNQFPKNPLNFMSLKYTCNHRILCSLPNILSICNMNCELNVMGSQLKHEVYENHEALLFECCCCRKGIESKPLYGFAYFSTGNKISCDKIWEIPLKMELL